MLRLEMLGNLGADPDRRSTGGGHPVTTFNMAHTERWNGPNGEKMERTEWVRFVAFGRQAELIAEHCCKGSQLWCAGALRTKRDGTVIEGVVVHVKEFEFVGPRQK